MRLSPLRVRLLACLAVAIPTGCGVVQPMAGVPTNAVEQTRMAPDAYKHILIYAGGDAATYVFTFPRGKLVATIAQASFGVCSDSSGDVFLTQVKDVLEYAHGGTAPIATFELPGTVYACSVDPTTGNLATVVLCFSRCSGDEVFVLQAPGVPPKIYEVSEIGSLLYCAYDGKGDLFVDGYNGTRFALAELIRGETAFTPVKLTHAIAHGAQIEWDGQDLAIESNLDPSIERVKISRGTGRVVGSTELGGVGMRAAQSWIADGKVAVPTAPGDRRAVDILFWNYPAGGNATNEFAHFIGRGHQVIDGVTFSRAVRP